MGKKTNEIRHLLIELASRYGDGDEDVMRLRLELSALESAKVLHKERRKSAANRWPRKVKAKELYLASKSGDGF